MLSTKCLEIIYSIYIYIYIYIYIKRERGFSIKEPTIFDIPLKKHNIYIGDLALNNLQWLIGHKTQLKQTRDTDHPILTKTVVPVEVPSIGQIKHYYLQTIPLKIICIKRIWH